MKFLYYIKENGVDLDSIYHKHIDQINAAEDPDRSSEVLDENALAIPRELSDTLHGNLQARLSEKGGSGPAAGPPGKESLGNDQDSAKRNGVGFQPTGGLFKKFVKGQDIKDTPPQQSQTQVTNASQRGAAKTLQTYNGSSPVKNEVSEPYQPE